MRRAMCRSGSVAARRERHSASNIGSSSLGGPGSRMTILRWRPTTVSMYCPGALPLALGITSAPSITSAWRALFSGIFMRRAAKRLYIAVRISALRRSPTPSAAAAAWRVRSSSVGPRPPEKITMSARSEGNPRRAGQVFQVVADDGLEGDRDAQLVEPRRQVERVGVLPEGRQHLRPGGNNLSNHALVLRRQPHLALVLPAIHHSQKQRNSCYEARLAVSILPTVVECVVVATSQSIIWV